MKLKRPYNFEIFISNEFDLENNLNRREKLKRDSKKRFFYLMAKKINQ